MKARDTSITRRFGAAIAAVAITVIVAPLPVEARVLVKVKRLEFPVVLSDGATHTIVGYLYYQGTFRNRTLQVAVHGATYNHTYWDFPSFNGRDYSYARYMAGRNYAVLAVDQLGAGESSKPLGTFVTLDETASALEQVLQQLRVRQNPLGHAFERIVLVGHSSGSINAIYLQATSRAADAIVVTASRHLVPPMPVPPGLVDLVLSLLPFPYFALPDAIRTALFHYLPGMDPDVAAHDNATADLWTNGQLLTTFQAFLNPAVDRVSEVTGPVLIQLGQFDALFPPNDPDVEAGLWGPGSDLTIQTLAGVGHDFNLHLDRQTGWRLIDRWIVAALEDSGDDDDDDDDDDDELQPRAGALNIR